MSGESENDGSGLNFEILKNKIFKLLVVTWRSGLNLVKAGNRAHYVLKRWTLKNKNATNERE